MPAWGSTRSPEAALEEITDVPLVTDSDYFNARSLPSSCTRNSGTTTSTGCRRVEELLDLVPEQARGGILFGEGFTFGELTRRFDQVRSSSRYRVRATV